MTNPLPQGVNPAPTSNNSPAPTSAPPAGHTSTPSSAIPSATASASSGEIVWSTVGDQCGADAGVKMLGYGDSGMGKTVLMATLPQPFVVISTENGLLSLSVKNLTKIFMGLGMDQEGAYQRALGVKKQPVMIVRNGLQLRNAFQWLSNPANSHLYRSVGWDGASDTAEVMLNAAKAVKADGRQAYGEVADIISEYFRKFRDHLPGKHVYITAKQGSLKDEVTGGIKWGPDFPGKQLGPQSPYWMDEVFRIGVATDPATSEPYRFLQTQPNEQYTAKDRSGMLERWERPDLAAIIEKITAQ